ncbi:hypothetical protein TVAG_140910 [Trichomonas vaginalis G3]|uniref:Exportin-T n=1 Tax=Trichomonas vaginalis (strain ATCC PRA-98 / G3) TaxID=412133 RepID=A2FER5_TRIV3|nr:exportin-T/LOS1 family [Trichomonas vaginalis G3]EAX96602.1 hypothetical protein TVAG_140910 [Trichomonas vaginalis G3]KAI5524101.1 exportin-T/LOS1 family [Trichomonas vaginalis G3]|eukprot:XP_001309532.1 hypothetical protein [Trichomonas vaginalis G3]
MSQCDVEKIETFVAALNSNEASEDDKMDAMDFLAEFMKQIDELLFSISHFTEFSSSQALLFILKLISYWINDRFSEITDEILSELKNVLFEQGLQMTSKIGQEFTSALTNTQIDLIFKAFPDNWPSFWQDIQKYGSNYIFRFSNMFCNRCSIITPQIFQNFSNFKNSLIANDVISQIYTMSFGNLNEISYSIISSLSKWADINWISDDSLFPSFLSGMNNPQYAKYIFDTFSSIITRNLDDSIKLSLISNVGNPQHVKEICSQAQNTEVYQSAAYFIYNAGLILINTENSLPYFELALEFLQQSEPISSIIAPFISAYIKQYPEYCSDTIPIVLNCCTEAFSNMNESGFPSISQKPFLDNLCNIISSCYLVDNDTTVATLNNIAQENFNIETNIPFVTSFLYLLNYMVDKTSSSTDFVCQYINDIVALASISNPIPSTHIFSVYLFFRLFVHLNDKFPSEIKQDVFTSLINFIVEEEIPETHLNGCIDFLIQLAKNQKMQLTISIEVLMLFIGTYNESLVGAAGALLRFVSVDESSEVIAQAIPHLAELMLNEETKLRGTSCILSFAAKIPNSSLSPNSISLLMEAISTCEIPAMESDDTISLYIKALSERQKSSANKDLINLMNALCGPKSICCFVNHMIVNRSSFSSEELVEVLNDLYQIFSVQIELFLFDLDTLNTSDSYSIVIRQFFKLMSDSVEVLTEDIINPLLDLADTALDRYYNNPIIFDGVIQFLSALSKQNPDEIIKRYLVESFNFIFMKNFDPNNPNGMKIVQRVSSFHRELAVSNPDLLMEYLLNVFGFFGLGIDDANNYIAIHDLDARVKNEELRKFFQDLVRLKKSIEF